MCNCAESRIMGEPNELNRHSCEYIAMRNSHIPAAEAFADRKARRSDPLWTRVFIRRMDMLVKADLGSNSQHDSQYDSPHDSQHDTQPTEPINKPRGGTLGPLLDAVLR